MLGWLIGPARTKQEKHGKIHHRSIWRICSKSATKWHLQLYLQSSVLMKQHTSQEVTSCEVEGVSCEASVSDPTMEAVSKNRNLFLFYFLSLGEYNEREVPYVPRLTTTTSMSKRFFLVIPVLSYLP